MQADEGEAGPGASDEQIAEFIATLAGAALAQNLSLRAPDWAQPLLASDITPTTGGRAVLAAEGIAELVQKQREVLAVARA